MVEQVDEIEADLQVALLSQPGQVVVLQNAGIELHQSGIAVQVSAQISLRADGRLRKVAGIE